MTYYSQTTSCVAPARPRQSLWARLLLAMAVANQRKALRNLDSARLRDIGLSKDQACTEANRPIWDVPQNWRK